MKPPRYLFHVVREFYACACSRIKECAESDCCFSDMRHDVSAHDVFIPKDSVVIGLTDGMIISPDGQICMMDRYQRMFNMLEEVDL